ncbi:hypothetical protein B0H19DRAFT_1262292 [Mycena capillaripes]|nr:hypothetical protein B0H19DRAFT_1262292 [Mycena capillaripes]
MWRADDHDSQDLLRPFRPNDWERLRIYATHIKELSILPDTDLSAILPALNLALTDDYIRLFLTAELTQFFLATPPDTNSVLSLFSTLGLRCPRLKNVRIEPHNFRCGYRREIQAVSLFVRGLEHLETIHVHLLDEAAMAHLRLLPRLKSLTLDTIPTGLMFPAFPALRDLGFMRAEIKPTTRFLATCNTLGRTTLQFDFNALYTTAEMYALLVALVSTTALASLTSLTLSNF